MAYCTTLTSSSLFRSHFLYFIKPMTNPTKMPIAVPYSIPTPELFSKNILENITPIDGPIY